MKSSIKVDYKSRYGGDFGEKEPIIKVSLISSEDPRDTLLEEIFKEKDPFCKSIQAFAINPDQKVGEREFVIFSRKWRERMINDIGSPMFMALTRYTGIEAEFVTSHDEVYFNLVSDYKVRSKGIKNYEIESLQWSDRLAEHMKEVGFIDRLMEEWKDLEQKVKKTVRKK